MSTSTTTKSYNHNQERAYTTALLRSMQFSGVQFLRYVTVDACNNIRCKVVPVKHLQRTNNNTTTASCLNNQVSIASVCYAGLPHFADIMIEGTGMNAKHVLTVQPDLNTFRNLPYARKTALVIGDLLDQYTDEPSPLCTRTLLKSVLQQAAELHNITFGVGVELEFCLFDAKTGKAVDESVYGNSTTLNQQEDFISELHDQLEQQYIPIELIHSESGPGQLEVVLRYSEDPVELADNVLLAQETIRAVAHQHGYKALFAPKYDMTKAGNGMHVHVSIRDATTGQSLFGNQGSSGVSAQGGAFMEGILNHLPALLGLSLPTVNSFRRVGKGCWTGSAVGWGVEDKEVGLRVCSNINTKLWDHFEYKLCDATCNLYLVLSGLLSAGLQGMERNLVLRPALGDNHEANTPAVVEAPLPRTVQEALDVLESDPLLMNVVGSQLGQGYLALRRAEAERADKMSFEKEVAEFLKRA